MSWVLATAWLTVLGLLCLAIGTGAQAWGAIAEYRDMVKAAPAAASRQFIMIMGIPAAFSLLTAILRNEKPPLWPLIRCAPLAAWSAIVAGPRKLGQIRAGGGDDAVRLNQLIRLASMWLILMAGSVLLLAAALIRLALAYR
jgi:hypothetical protein